MIFYAKSRLWPDYPSFPLPKVKQLCLSFITLHPLLCYLSHYSHLIKVKWASAWHHLQSSSRRSHCCTAVTPSVCWMTMKDGSSIVPQMVKMMGGKKKEKETLSGSHRNKGKSWLALHASAVFTSSSHHGGANRERGRTFKSIRLQKPPKADCSNKLQPLGLFRQI